MFMYKYFYICGLWIVHGVLEISVLHMKKLLFNAFNHRVSSNIPVVFCNYTYVYYGRNTYIMVPAIRYTYTEGGGSGGTLLPKYKEQMKNKFDPKITCYLVCLYEKIFQFRFCCVIHFAFVYIFSRNFV